jgi:hypothetical protein
MASVIDLPDLIRRGKLDSHLDRLGEAVFARKKALRIELGLRMQKELKVGDRVAITNNIKPGYLAGAEGTVEDKTARRPGSMCIKLDYPRRRYHRVELPAAALERIE